MPRLYAPNQAHTIEMGAVDFLEGVAAVAEGADTAFFTAGGYAVDASKHTLSPFDSRTLAELRVIATYLGLTYTAATTKQTLVRSIETYVSTATVGALTVTSEAGTAVGDSKVTITEAAGEGNTFAFKTAKTTAPAILYMDEPGDTYTAFESAADITPDAADHDKITVVELNAAGQVVSVGTQTLTVKAAG